MYGEHTGICLYLIFSPAVSQTEQEDWQRWKEEHRPGPVQLAPVRLGNRDMHDK